MIYSVIPYEVIMSGEEELPQAEWISGGGRFFQVCRQGNERVISRMMSTNPADYLKPEYAPGTPFN